MSRESDHLIEERELRMRELRMQRFIQRYLDEDSKENYKTLYDEEVRCVEVLVEYNRQLTIKNDEMEETIKRQEEEIEKTKKEEKLFQQLYDYKDEATLEKVTEIDTMDVHILMKEKNQACSEARFLRRLHGLEALRRKEIEEKLRKVCVTPPYFICPITQDVMQEPCVAADGFTYETEALRSWFERGHNTSPMTNLRLPHNNLVPNRSLRSDIQEWLQRNRSL